MEKGSVTALSKYRFETAVNDLETAKILFQVGQWKASLNRSYYAIFHALRSVNALDKFDTKRHSGVIAYFNQHYVKTGILNTDIPLHRLIDDAFKMRSNADYEDFYVVSREQVKKQIEDAGTVLDVIRPYLEERWE